MKQKRYYHMKKIFCLLLTLVLLLGILPVSALADTVPEQDNGVYQVATAQQLSWIADQVASGNNMLSVKLTQDITLPENWQGIGTAACKFAGSFDGDGHTVTLSNSSWGLFGFVMGKKNAVATISNVITAGTVKNTPIAADVGYAHIQRCINKAQVNASCAKVGGIVGTVTFETIAGVHYTDVKIMECGNEAAIKALYSVGGILGFADCGTLVSRCYNTGNINGYECTGGLVGSLQNQNGGGTVEYSYNTGKVEGRYPTGGIVGELLNSVTIHHCYNSGETEFAFAGSRYNHTSRFGDGCYFLGVNSAKCSPDATLTMHHDAISYEITTRATAKSAAEMATAAFAQALGSYFKQSCPTPVLSWQETTPHSGELTCTNCLLGSTEKEIYKVSYQTHDYFTLTGPATVQQGGSIEIQLEIAEGYKRNGAFAVKANGVKLTEQETGKFVVTNATGPLSITVMGVQQRKSEYDIKWNDVGNGYRIIGSPKAPEGKDYSFEINFETGFKEHKDLFEVRAVEIVNEDLLKQGAVPNEMKLDEDLNGKYYISKVNSDYRIVVSGVDTYDTDSVTVNFRVTEGYNEFHTSDNPDNIMADIQLEVPYFDLGLYGLGKYYYNPDCYMTDGVVNGRQIVGNPEIAYNNVTVMHAFIVATERFRMGYSQDEVGKALHKTTHTEYKNAFDPENKEEKKVSWSQDVGSSFMDFWTHGTNLNYYVNYVYPIGAPGWGSTSDQILLKDGDDLTVHLITGAGSGSRFGVFTVNDRYKEFSQDTTRNEYTVQQGQKLNLTLYWTGNADNYGTSYSLVSGSNLYWIEDKDMKADIRDWNVSVFGDTDNATPEDWRPEDGTAMRTDKNGTVTINTAGVAPGTYYIAAPGAYSENGAMDANNKPSPAEAGTALFKLTVEKSDFDGLLGDVDGSGTITAEDATKVLRAVVGLETDINLAIADVNGSGTITADDATCILQRIVGLIPSFPAENQ